MEKQDGEVPGRPIEWPQLIGGIVAGWILCWALLVVTVLTAYRWFGDSPALTGLYWVALAALPVGFGAAALARRRRGQLVAGALMGLAIGAIVGGGICAGVSVVDML